MLLTITRLLTPRHSRTTLALNRLREAYVNLFNGTGSKEDAELVLSDLARTTGYFHTDTEDDSDAVLRFRAGQRSVFGRVMQFLDMPEEGVRELAEAVRLEDATSEQTGVDL